MSVQWINRSQKTSKWGKNISDTLACSLCCTFLFLITTFQCHLWSARLYNWTDTWQNGIYEGLPGIMGNKGTLAKYRREQGNISQFLGTGEQNLKNYSCTKTFWKCVGTWEHRAILEGNKDPPPPPPPPLGDPHLYVLKYTYLGTN